MTEKPMAPNSALSGGNQSQTVAEPSVEHGAEAKGNRPAMTDEERAREIVRVLCGDSAAACDQNAEHILEAFAAIRAEVREACAISCEVHAATVRGPNKGTPWSAAHECAAAIRAMGDKG